MPRTGFPPPFGKLVGGCVGRGVGETVLVSTPQSPGLHEGPQIVGYMLETLAQAVFTKTNTFVRHQWHVFWTFRDIFFRPKMHVPLNSDRPPFLR